MKTCSIVLFSTHLCVQGAKHACIMRTGYWTKTRWPLTLLETAHLALSTVVQLSPLSLETRKCFLGCSGLFGCSTANGHRERLAEGLRGTISTSLNTSTVPRGAIAGQR